MDENEKVIPAELKKGYFIKLSKKCDLSSYSNYREITLSSNKLVKSHPVEPN
ncbi:hypothetical protein DPMN_008699 [Dreissena polymorpha]|uniref:Uncharacterized protein n=1 Tax=Dreissena polymorpha TaxID=45954 RepID=A0A9D4RZH5_DREPO|nr:hypothetical protein DPMN_008699 [Dreissena polymorpha]